MVFAFQVLPTIIFFSSLMAVLYHLGIVQLLVKLMAWVMTATMRVSGAESLSVAANVFVGQTEAPLVVRPYISKMTQSELMALMTGGFATIAGSVLAAYISMVGAEYAKHFLAASVMSAPAAFVMAKIMLPETEESLTAGKVKIRFERQTVNVIDAAASGAGDGLKLALNVAAMLLAFVALLALIDWPLGLISEAWDLDRYLGGRTLSIRTIFGYLLWPVAWLLGVPTQDCTVVGGLLGTKIAATELVAYMSLHDVMAVGGLSPRSVIICTYALCGFANFASIAIQLGGIGGIAPDRKHDLARLGLRAMIGGALASFMTAAIAGLLVAPDTDTG
jgi:CNT family concentrative nucleoside transporter